MINIWPRGPTPGDRDGGRDRNSWLAGRWHSAKSRRNYPTQGPSPGPPSPGFPLGIPRTWDFRSHSLGNISVPKAEKGEKSTTRPSPHAFSCWTWLLPELDGGTPEVPGKQPGAESQMSRQCQLYGREGGWPFASDEFNSTNNEGSVPRPCDSPEDTATPSTCS